jgi:hypothetical protein
LPRAHKTFGLLLTILVLAAVAAPGGDSAIAIAAAPPRPHYELHLDLDLERNVLTAVQTLDYTNPTTATLGSLVFHVMPAYYGSFALTSTTVDSEVVTPTLDGIVLELSLPRSLPPGQATQVVLQYRLNLTLFGAANGIIALGDWFPVLAVYQGGWDRHRYTEIGDAFFTDLADYDVFLTTSQPATVAATGEVVTHQDRDWQLRARQVRDFALAISTRYQVQSKDLDGVTLSIYYPPEQAPEAAEALVIGAEAVRWYVDRLGPYPYPNLGIAVASKQAHNAQEHPCLVFLRSDMLAGSRTNLRILTAHELAHQWFYGMVGNDQLHDPWLDEALVVAVSLDFFRQHYPDEYADLWESWGDFRNNTPVNRSIYDFPDGTTYFDVVYRQGATFLRELSEAMGETAYWQGLQSYFQAQRFRLARPQDFFRAMRAAAPDVDLLPLYRRYFDYPFLQYTHLTLDVEAPANSAWAGARLPLHIEADAPHVQVQALLDDQPLVAGDRLEAITLDAALPAGEHTLLVIADDDGLNRVERRLTFTVVQPTVTPTTPPPRPSPTRVEEEGEVASTATPSPTPLNPLGDRLTVWRLVGALAIVATVSLLVAGWRLIHK